MASYSYVYILADPKRNLFSGVTKNLDVAVMQDELAKDVSLKLVHVEQFNTIKDALARLKTLKKMNQERRAKLVRKFNPDWKNLLPPNPVFAGPSYSSEDFPPPAGSGGGVGARVPRPPILPLVAADAKAWPDAYQTQPA